jgi:integrase
MKLTKTAIDDAEKTGRRHILWDDELPGFGLRVEANGAKVFIVRYRADGGGRGATQRQSTIGRYGTLTAAQARKAAEKTLAAAALGQDPVGDLAAKRREMKVSELIDLYAAEGCIVQRGIRQGEPMKPTTKAYTLARLRHHVVPLLGTRRVSELTEGDVERFVRDVAKGRTAKDVRLDKKRGRVIVRGGEGAARKVVRDLSAMLSFAQRRRIISANPVATASVRKTDGRRERFLTTDEVKRLGKALDALGVEGGRGLDKHGNPRPAMNAKALDIVRLLVLTGCRRNEVAGLRWSEVDLDRGLLIFSDTKTGKSVRPLAAAAAVLLRELRDEAGSDAVFVFPAERGDGFFVGTKGVWAEVVEKAGLPGVTPHTLRHTLGAAAASGGEGLLLVGAILGHQNARSTAIYAHVDRDPARLAADRATAGIAAALGRPVKGANDPDLPVPANDAA